MLQVYFAGEVSTAQQLAHENGEPDIDLIDPGRVLRGEMKHDAVAAVAEKRQMFPGAQAPIQACLLSRQ